MCEDILVDKVVLGQYAAELYGNGKHNPTAYFPTPMHLCDLMVKMLMDKTDKTASVCDPCVGSGRLLMVASNYSLNLYGMDIDPLILKSATSTCSCMCRGAFADPRLSKVLTMLKNHDNKEAVS